MVYVLSAVEKVSSKFCSKTKINITMACILLLATDNRGWGYARRHVVLCESGLWPICYLHNHRFLVTRDYTISYARCRRWKIVWCTIRLDDDRMGRLQLQRLQRRVYCCQYLILKHNLARIMSSMLVSLIRSNRMHSAQTKNIQNNKLVCTRCNNQQSTSNLAPWMIQQYYRREIEVLTTEVPLQLVVCLMSRLI